MVSKDTELKQVISKGDSAVAAHLRCHPNGGLNMLVDPRDSIIPHNLRGLTPQNPRWGGRDAYG